LDRDPHSVTVADIVTLYLIPRPETRSGTTPASDERHFVARESENSTTAEGTKPGLAILGSSASGVVFESEEAQERADSSSLALLLIVRFGLIP
jgi:hypothetical protein